MQLTPHFSLEEFIFSEIAIRKLIDNTPLPDVMPRLILTAEGMEHVRAALGYPVRISSGHRCLLLNREIGSSDTSDHVKGYAVDFTCAGYGPPKEVVRKLIDSGLKFDQLIYEGSWVHIGFNPKMRQKVMTAIFHKDAPTTYIMGV